MQADESWEQRFEQTSCGSVRKPWEMLGNPVTVKLSKLDSPEPMLESAIRQPNYELYVQRGKARGGG